MDADDLAKARAMFAALPEELSNTIKAMAADETLRPSLAATLEPFGLTLEEIDEVLADE
ncbi:MAG: hypothetical protein ABSE66_09855 [Thermoplasmata archaeon]|jgi:hypothetical protein